MSVADPILEHPCYVLGCKTVAFRIMCRKHWSMIPAALRVEVLTPFVPALPAEKQSPQFKLAVEKARRLVAARESTR